MYYNCIQERLKSNMYIEFDKDYLQKLYEYREQTNNNCMPIIRH